MQARSTAVTLPGALALAAMLCGCAGEPAPILRAQPDAPRWPAAPDTPRLVYLGEIASDEDLRPSRGLLRNIGSAVFGDSPARTMQSPVAVCTDGASRVFVADSGGGVVHVFDLGTREYAQRRPPQGFTTPVAVACDASGGLLVVDSVAACVFAFDPAGALRATLGVGVLRRPCGVAVSPDGRIFIADTGAHQVVVLAPDGTEVARLGSRGVGPGQFNFPTNLALAADGSLLVSDTLNFRVQVFSPDLQPVGTIGSQGDLPGYFQQPKGVAVDPDGHVYVMDANFEALQLFTREGALLMTVGHEGHGPGEFWLPAGISIDATGRVWIADSYNQRVQVFQYLPESRQ